jgi:hypothetical protein
MVILKPVFLIVIVAVAMIGMMTPSAFAELYVSEINDYTIILSDSWEVDKDLKNETWFSTDKNPNSFMIITHSNISVIHLTESAKFNLINNVISDIFGYDISYSATKTPYIDGNTAYQGKKTYLQDSIPVCFVIITLIPNNDYSWILTEFDCGENTGSYSYEGMANSFKFSLLQEQRQKETNDIKTEIDIGIMVTVGTSNMGQLKDLQLLENNDYDLLQINYLFQSDEGNSAADYPFGSMRAVSDFSLDYDSWTPYNFLTTDDATWMGTTLPGSDEWDVECPSYLGKNINPNIPYTITACYEIPKTVNYFYFENIVFSKSTISPFDTLRATMAQQEKETQQEKITQLEAEKETQQAKITQLEAEQNGGGCLIATATYGSELSPQVQLLREIRDNQLMNTEYGTAFMGMFNDVYYSFSPVIADYERENPLFKEAVKIAITPMISSLSLMENANSESEVISLGLSVIMLNIGMYLGVPAVVIVGIRKQF